MKIRKILKHLSDRKYIQLHYLYHFHKLPCLKNPQTYNDKLQWLKLNDKNPLYTTIVDKYLVKEYVERKIGKEFILPTLGVYDSVDDIDFDKLPNKFVLKWNHDSGSIVICKDKKNMNVDDVKNKLKHGAEINGFWYGREWPYKNVQPKIIAEPYLEDVKTKELRDYKIFTFNGKAKYLLIASERQKQGVDTKFDFFDIDTREHLSLVNVHENAKIQPELPQNLELMKNLSEKLSEGFRHLRVDFYEVNGKVVFGELTLFHGSGFMTFKPEKWNYILGSMITLPID